METKKRALVTGSLGQDGSYLCEYLLSLGYQVFGTVRWSPSLSSNISEKVAHDVNYLHCDVTNRISIIAALQKSQPDEIYNLAGQPFVPVSWLDAKETFNVNVGGLASILEGVDAIWKQDKYKVRVYQASSSEMFGNSWSVYHTYHLNEDAKMAPTSPYGVSKLAAHELCRVYRQAGYYVTSGILFNHESPRRGREMVTRKISLAVADWLTGGDQPLYLGNVDAKRDWGFAGDYVRAMHAMLQLPVPQDFVIGTGEAHSVQEFLQCALDKNVNAAVGDWDTMRQKKINSRIHINENLKRTNEIHTLVADASRAKLLLGWKPKVSFKELVAMMVAHDVAHLQSIRGQQKVGAAV